MDVRVATSTDLDGVTEMLTAAFASDPLWSWAFPERHSLERWWRFLIASAMRYPWVWILGDYEAASVWIPPGGTEVTPGEEEAIPALLEELAGERSVEISELLDRFDSSHPRERPHYYLSLLGTHPAKRGRGIGMALLAENLRRIDEEGHPSYLESSNPANDPRYEQHGFQRIGSFDRPDGGLTVATMWRERRDSNPAP